VLAAAAFYAVYREIRGVRTWSKTAHTGAHRPSTAELDGYERLTRLRLADARQNGHIDPLAHDVAIAEAARAIERR
jgi:hypothetical protein